MEDNSAARRTETAPTLEELAEVVGCPAGLEAFGGRLPSTTHRAATDGKRCEIGDDIVDFYDRAPVTGSEGGTLENIDAALGTKIVEEGCEGLVLTGETWFIFSSNEAILRDAEDALDSVVRPVLPAMPLASYPVPPVGVGCGV